VHSPLVDGISMPGQEKARQDELFSYHHSIIYYVNQISGLRSLYFERDKISAGNRPSTEEGFRRACAREVDGCGIAVALPVIVLISTTPELWVVGIA